MPAQPSVAPGLGNYLKKNARFAYGGGMLGSAFLAGDIKGIFDADNKLKALLKTFKDFIVVRVAMAGVFTAVAAGVRSLVRDTGSLDAALKKLGQMQVFSRQLQGFVGGLNAARQRISQLAVLSEKGPFKFDELAEANKNLEVFTRGAYSSVEATREIGTAAIATGNNIADVAQQVGVFYDNLRSGQPVRQSAEQMRQMGLITQATADQLTEMADGGEEATVVLNKLTDALKQSGTGAEGYKNELQSVTAEQQKAADILKEKFAMPFTAQEIQNAQNYTAAMKGITPVVGRIGQSLATVYTGFGTATSAFGKFIATSKTGHSILEGVAYVLEALTVAAVAFGTYAAATLTPTILKMGGAFTKMGAAAAAATWAVRGAALLTVWGLVASAVASVIGIFINLSRQAKLTKQAYDDWNAAQDETTSNLNAQVAAITTLTDKNAALAKGMQRLIELEKERQALDEKARQRIGKEAPHGIKPYLRSLVPTPTNIRKVWDELTGTTERERKLDEQKKKKIETEKQATEETIKNAVAVDTVNKQLVEEEAKRRFEIEQTSKGIQQRDYEARTGLKAQAEYEKNISNIESERLRAQAKLDADRARFRERGKTDPMATERHYRSTVSAENRITDLMKQRQDLALQAPEFSATYLEARAEQMRQAKEVNTLQQKKNDLDRQGAPLEKKREVNIQLRRARTLAGGEEYNAAELFARETAVALARKREAAPPGPEESRQARVQQLQIETEIRGHQARRRGDIAGAQIQEDIADFTRNFEQLRPILGKQAASSVALAKTQDDIAQQYVEAQKIVSSMTAIGGGGGVSGVNPQLESARRREVLQQEMVKLLGILAGQEAGIQGQESTFAP